MIGPLPPEWCQSVIRILRKGNSPSLRWSFRARQDWQQMGMPPEAHALLIRTLQQPGIWGEQIFGMHPLPNPPPKAGTQTVYAFLCVHPLGFPTPLYAKIGLFADEVTIDLFSLHIDLTDKLAERTAKAQKKRK